METLAGAPAIPFSNLPFEWQFYIDQLEQTVNRQGTVSILIGIVALFLGIVVFLLEWVLKSERGARRDQANIESIQRRALHKAIQHLAANNCKIRESLVEGIALVEDVVAISGLDHSSESIAYGILDEVFSHFGVAFRISSDGTGATTLQMLSSEEYGYWFMARYPRGSHGVAR